MPVPSGFIPAVACFPALSGLRLAELGTCETCRMTHMPSGGQSRALGRQKRRLTGILFLIGNIMSMYNYT